GQIIKKGKITEKQQVVAARIASVTVAGLSIVLALFAQNMNVAFLVALAFCVAASANLPVIVYTIYWKRFNTAGAVSAMLSGLFSALILVAISPNVLSPTGDAFITAEPLISLTNPAIISVPIGFIGGVVGTLLSKERDDAKYAEVKVRANIGYRKAE
ncbi:sodium:solute symporter family transporter, partial [Shouchella clausii]